MIWNPKPAPMPTIKVRSLLDILYDLELAYEFITPSQRAAVLVAFESTARAYLGGE